MLGLSNSRHDYKYKAELWRIKEQARTTLIRKALYGIFLTYFLRHDPLTSYLCNYEWCKFSFMLYKIERFRSLEKQAHIHSNKSKIKTLMNIKYSFNENLCPKTSYFCDFNSPLYKPQPLTLH